VGREIKLWDTAGIRRKSRVTGKIEKLAVSDALRAIRFADCVVVLIDASMEIERQDLALSDLAMKRPRWGSAMDRSRTSKSSRRGSQQRECANRAFR
jgi:predicted GTPase